MKKSNFWKMAFLIQSCISILITSYFLTETNSFEAKNKTKEDVIAEIAIETDFATIAKAAEMQLDTSDFKELIQQQTQNNKTAFTNTLSLQCYNILFDATGKVKTIEGKIMRCGTKEEIMRCRR